MMPDEHHHMFHRHHLRHHVCVLHITVSGKIFAHVVTEMNRPSIVWRFLL